MTRWIVIAAFDALLELLILGLSIVVIFPLRMSVQRKAQASICFILRLPYGKTLAWTLHMLIGSRIIILICLQVKYLSDFSSAANAGVALTRPILFRQSEVLYSLLSAAMPSLNQYLRKFDTTQATVFGYNAGTYGSARRSYQMDSLGAPRSKNEDTKPYARMGTGDADEDLARSTDNNFLASRNTRYHANVEGPHNDGRSNASQEEGSIGRHNSDELIIRKDVEYTVRQEA